MTSHYSKVRHLLYNSRMNEFDASTHNNQLVIAVPSHGAFDFEGQLPVPSGKSLDRVFAAVAVYFEELNKGTY